MLRHKRITTVFVSHDQEVVAVADHVITLGQTSRALIEQKTDSELWGSETRKRKKESREESEKKT